MPESEFETQLLMNFPWKNISIGQLFPLFQFVMVQTNTVLGVLWFSIVCFGKAQTKKVANRASEEKKIRVNTSKCIDLRRSCMSPRRTMTFARWRLRNSRQPRFLTDETCHVQLGYSAIGFFIIFVLFFWRSRILGSNSSRNVKLKKRIEWRNIA